MFVKNSLFDRLVVVLIKPTHYDDDGFPYRYWRGVLPSNSLAVMHSLTKQAIHQVVAPKTKVEVYMLEDSVSRHADKLKSLYRRFPEKGTKLIVGLVAVQTAQFPRACDLINRWQKKGATCVIGGFHVSGSISENLDGIKDSLRVDVPCEHKMPAEIQTLMNKGVVVFHGEAENSWSLVLSDILNGQQKKLYRGGKPDLTEAPLPEYSKKYFKRSFATAISTFDTGRGCPFACSFCSIINVQGRKPRYRKPQAILKKIKDICEQYGKVSFFFTDDNFARNPLWEELLDGLIMLRQQDYKINFMVEADLASYRIKKFIPKLAAAGCTQIFMGVESMNPKNLLDIRKQQNQVKQYKQLWNFCHEYGVIVHAGYIIGFPYDTPESVKQDVKELFDYGVDQVSFFVLTPIPGSEDHARAAAARISMDKDFNKYDSFHTVVSHPLMLREEWLNVYTKAWPQFYNASNMITALKRFKSREARYNLLRNYLWYCWSFATELTHPMIAGFYRVRDYTDRRPSTKPISYQEYILQEIVRHVRYVSCLFGEFYRFQYIILETEYASNFTNEYVAGNTRMSSINDWLRFTFGKRINRQWLHSFWKRYSNNRWQLLWNPLKYHWHIKMIPYAISEIVYSIRFAFMLLKFIRIVRK